MYMYVYIPHVCGCQSPRTIVTDSCELMWVLGTELYSSTGAINH